MRTKTALPTAALGQTVHFVGDPHFASASSTTGDRAAKVANDLSYGQIPLPIARVCVGDFTNEVGAVNNAADDAYAVARFNGYPGAVALGGSVPWYTAVGNHDIFANNRTAAAAAAAFTQASLNQVIDLGGFIVIIVNPDTMPINNTRICLPVATVAWLDAQLAAATKPCFIVCHAPLKSTATDARADNATIFDSTFPDWYVEQVGTTGTDAPIRAVLDRHENAIAWVSGHLHIDPRFAVNLFANINTGTRQIAHINCPVIQYTTPGNDVTDPTWGVFTTYRSDGKIDVRLRNHHAGVWDVYNYSRVTTLTPT